MEGLNLQPRRASRQENLPAPLRWAFVGFVLLKVGNTLIIDDWLYLPSSPVASLQQGHRKALLGHTTSISELQVRSLQIRFNVCFGLQIMELKSVTVSGFE